MDKILIYYGPRDEFERLIPERFYLLETLVDLSDSKHKLIGRAEVPDTFTEVVAYTMSYSSITAGGIQNFSNLLDYARGILKEVYLQNPPDCIKEELLRVYGAKIVEIKYFKYKKIASKDIKSANESFSNTILGQETVKKKLLSIMYEKYSGKNDKKPQVVMFYGPSGVGKTETAKYLGSLLGGDILRLQLSMFQTNDYFSYLYGTEHNAGSFCKELLERKTNVILFDEFDKAHPAIWKAFYQLFDEGVYKDKNYTVELHDAIIICTSNEPSPEAIRKILGDPLFYRINHVIRFSELDISTKRNMINRIVDEIYVSLSEEEQLNLDKDDLYLRYIPLAEKFVNYRHAYNIIKNSIMDHLVEVLLSKE